MTTIKGYKVTDENLQCRGFQFEVGKTFKEDVDPSLCNRGFHFCEKASNCFNYYNFDSNNRVFEVEASGKIVMGDDKHCATEITFLRELTWLEVLSLVNTGSNNTGRDNSGDRNSGNRNSGNWNSGYSNSGNWNSGDSNSGNWNSGDSNSGNWNSGNRNSGDSNSGYRNDGAFCTDTNPKIRLFDKEVNMTVKEWENSEVCNLMYRIDPTIWVNSSMMSEQEKKEHPKHETTGGYLKTIPMKEAWANFWGNLEDNKKKLFLDLPNFDADKFKHITGIDVGK